MGSFNSYKYWIVFIYRLKLVSGGGMWMIISSIIWRVGSGPIGFDFGISKSDSTYIEWVFLIVFGFQMKFRFHWQFGIPTMGLYQKVE